MEEFMLCALCKGQLIDPRSLDCMHSLCFTCLQKHYMYIGCSDKITCIKCTRETSIPCDGIGAIKCNPMVIAAIKETQKNSDPKGLLTTMKSNGITILSPGAILHDFVKDLKPTLLYALFYRQNVNEALFQHAVSLFTRFAMMLTSLEPRGNADVKSETIIRFVAIDMDKCSFEPLDKCVNENDVALWRSGSYTIINKEYMECFQEVSNVAFMRYNQTETPTILEKTPLVRAKISMGCPNEGCKKQETKWDWHCCACLAVLEYSFDNDQIFCDCGAWKNTVKSYEASCGNASHPFTKIEHSRLRNLLKDLQKVKDLSILVLGETGVGKTTWINAIANYVTSSSLKEAEEDSNFRCLIKYAFERPSCNVGPFDTTLPKVTEMATNETEKAKNTNTSVNSDTNIPSVYLIPTRNYNVRIIDTPGMGDTRGKVKDLEHCENILHFLANSEFKEIHGICVLLKSGNTRLNESYQYCLTEIFKQLHETAAKNIIFVFTYARISHYEDDQQTLSVLKNMLLNIEDKTKVRITAEIGINVFSIDNETFEYLRLSRKKKIYSSHQISDYEKSWNHSKAQTDRLFKYADSLTPYDIHNSSSIYVARNILAGILKPALELYKIQDDNFKSMNKALEDYENGSNIFGDKIYVRLKKKVIVDLGSRSYLCNGCEKTKIINKTDGEKYNEEEYVMCRVCERNVSIWSRFKAGCDSVALAMYNNDPEYPFRETDIKCKTCGCSITRHDFSSSSEATVTYYDYIENIQKLKEKLNETQWCLSKTANIVAKFSFFLRRSALAKYCYEILKKIVELNGNISYTSSEEVKAQNSQTLRIFKKIHDDDMAVIPPDMLLEPKQIFELRDELYKIKYIGKELKTKVDNDEKDRTELIQKETLSSSMQRLVVRMIDSGH